MKKILLGFMFLCAIQSFSQSKPFQVSGILISEESKLPLESATVYLERVKDSTLVTYTISNKKGVFVLNGKTSDKNLNLYVSYVGFKTYTQNISINKSEIDLKQINLKTNTNLLNEVIVKSRAPITIKDTLEFNVKSFKTKKDATVEDLLRELPGVEIDEDGKIKVNGKNVSKILVNGQPFFGNDLTIATRNLTKDIIDKVQVVDSKTKAQAFTGEVGDSKSRTINLTVKKENSKSIFGRIAAGGGTNKRYELAGLFSIFNDDKRISVLGGGNNINSPGFSFGDINRMAGGRGGNVVVEGRRVGGNNGITTSRNGGVNYTDKYGKKTDISSSYFHSATNSVNNRISNRENFLPDSKYFTTSNSNNFNDGSNHKVDFGIDIKIDSTILINIKPSFSYNNNISDYRSEEQSMNADRDLTNESSTNSFSESIDKNFGNNLSVTKKFKTKGSFLKFGFGNTINTTKIDNYLNSETNIYGIGQTEIDRNQFIDEDRKHNVLSYSVGYRMPLIGEKTFLDFSYFNTKNVRSNNKRTYDFNNADADFTDLNENLSTDFKYTEISRIPILSFVYNKDKLYFTINGGYKFRTLKNEDKLRPELSLKHNFEHFEQTINFRYKFSPSKSLRLNYYSANTAPNLSQLQPIEDVSNPLNIIKGNPKLTPSNRHALSIWYQNYNFQKKSGYYAHLYGSAKNKAITLNTTVDENFVRTSTYTNVNGNYNWSAGLGVNRGVKIDSLKTLRFSLGFNGSINRSVNFNNGDQYATIRNSFSPNTGIYFDWRNIMQFRSNYGISFSKARFNLAVFENEKYITHNLRFNTSSTFFKKLEWSNDIVYSYSPNITNEFQKSAWFCNATLSYSIMKDKAILSLKAYDLLNQNTNARRIATQNYIEDSQSTILRQYFMLGFSWKFNKKINM